MFLVRAGMSVARGVGTALDYLDLRSGIGALTGRFRAGRGSR